MNTLLHPTRIVTASLWDGAAATNSPAAGEPAAHGRDGETLP
jgi:hypothetical protein